MINLILISTGATKAIFPLFALLFKGAAIGAKKHGIKKAIVNTAKDAAKDKVKEEVKKKTSDKKKDN